MGEISIWNSLNKGVNNLNTPLSFKSYDGLYPLMKVPEMYRSDHILEKNGHRRSIRRISNKLFIESGGNVYPYQSIKGILSFYSGYFSLIGIPNSLTYLPSSLYDPKYSVSAVFDVLLIGAVKTTALPEVHYTTQRYRNTLEIVIKSENLVILVPEEKIRRTKYCKDYYTLSVRNEILRVIDRFSEDSNIQVIDVPMDYFQRFYSSDKRVTTNSVVEMIQIENSIKDDVFSNLNQYIA